MTTVSNQAASFRILYLDPDRQWLNIMRRELMDAGLRDVMTTTDPREALAKIRDADPDLLITDHDLKLVQFLRQNDASPNREIPIIVVSGNIDPEGIASLRDAGVNEIGVKPCSISQLVQRIEAIVSRPREFVVLDNFVGPSRRRKSVPHDGTDRRSD